MADDEDGVTVVKNSKAKAAIWANFGLLMCTKTKTITPNVAICIKCKQHVKYSGGTTNLTSHMRVYHPAATDSRPNVTVSTCSSKTQQTLPSVIGTKYHPKSPKAIKINDTISNFIIKDLRPYRIVDSPEFREMISALDPRYQVPSRKQFAEVFIPQKYQQVKEVVKAELLSAEQVAVTTDGWTSRSTESYITVTSTHINSSWELVNYVLQTRCMPDNHTGEHIADGLREALKEWNIPEQPLYLVSDNASNMIKAGELLDCACHLGCYAHTLNLAAQKGLRIKTVSNILAKVRRIVAFFHRSAVAANLLKTQATLLGIPNKKLIIDVCTRWNSAFDMLHRYLEMQVAVVGVLMSKDLKVKDKDLKFLSDEDIKVAEEVVKCLQPLKTVTTTLCSEKVPTLSIVLPLHRQLLDHFLKVGEQDSATVKNMKSAMAADLAARYLDKVDMLTLAAVLDPRFKSLPFLSEEDRFLVYNKVVATLSRLPNQRVTVKVEPGSVSEPQPELPSLSLPSLPGLDNVDVATANSISATEKSDDIGASCTSPKKPKLDEPASLLTDILGDVYVVKVETKSPLQRAEEEVAKYKDIPVIPLSENPLKWWQKHAESYPLLSHLAKKILCIPGTSVPSERVFSTAGDIVSAQRSNLKSKHVDMLIFLKKNMK